MSLLGFDVGGTNIKAGLFDDGFLMLSKKSVRFSKEISHGEIFKKMREAAAEMLSENGLGEESVKALGVAVAGAVDDLNGIVLRAHNLNFYDVPVRTEMARLFPGAAVSVINDADAATLAEYKLGALKGCKNALLLTLGTGMGGGAIIGGRLWGGGLGHGFEPGHVTIDKNGSLCTCGNRGCAETLCSATWIKNRAGKDVKTVFDLAKNGDHGSIEIVNEYIDNLSTAIASLTAVFDPEIIALGGGVGLAGSFLTDPLAEKVAQKSFFKHPYKIVPAALGNDAGMTGAAIAAVIL